MGLARTLSYLCSPITHLTLTLTLLLPPPTSSYLIPTPRRPIKDLTDALIEVGCTIEHLESASSLPIRVASTGLTGGRIELSGKVSSQFVSSVLISACVTDTRTPPPHAHRPRTHGAAAEHGHAQRRGAHSFASPCTWRRMHMVAYAHGGVCTWRRRAHGGGCTWRRMHMAEERARTPCTWRGVRALVRRVHGACACVHDVRVCAYHVHTSVCVCVRVRVCAACVCMRVRVAVRMRRSRSSSCSGKPPSLNRTLT
jgi:hypothetical protein